MKLESLSIKNLRSLTESCTFNLRPLTLVVGANSTGKSTFIRSFPLLRQSIETMTRGPILWFGRFVDFGIFEDAVSKGVPIPQIEFSFTVTLPENSNEKEVVSYLTRLLVLEETQVKVTLVVAAIPGSSGTFAKQIRVQAWGREVKIDTTPDGTVESMYIDNEPLQASFKHLLLRTGTSLFSFSVLPGEIGSEVRDKSPWPHSVSACPELLYEHIADLFHGNTYMDKILSSIRILGIGSCSKLLRQATKALAVTPTSRARSLQLSETSHWMKSLQGLIIADRAPQLINEIDGFVSSIMKGVNYIGPLRATAERFYRQQDLAVDEVDPQGTNLAMFLMGLGTKRQRDFSNWCQQNIGFTVEAKTVGAHVSINLRDSLNGDLLNVADMGFGYSQLLPVLATLWRAVTTRGVPPIAGSFLSRSSTVTRDSMRFYPPKFIAIEQPELHLHPRLQGRLADLMCAIVKNRGVSRSQIHLLCETHSETIVNRIGKLIYEGLIDRENVQILLFEKEGERVSTNVRVAEYDEDGILQNWPYGFFLPED